MNCCRTAPTRSVPPGATPPRACAVPGGRRLRFLLAVRAHGDYLLLFWPGGAAVMLALAIDLVMALTVVTKPPEKARSERAGETGFTPQHDSVTASRPFAPIPSADQERGLSFRRRRQTVSVHPFGDRIEVTSADHIPLAAQVQSADETHEPGFKAALDHLVLFSVGPCRAGLEPAPMIVEPASAIEQVESKMIIANAFARRRAFFERAPDMRSVLS